MILHKYPNMRVTNYKGFAPGYCISNLWWLFIIYSELRLCIYNSCLDSRARDGATNQCTLMYVHHTVHGNIDIMMCLLISHYWLVLVEFLAWNQVILYAAFTSSMLWHPFAVVADSLCLEDLDVPASMLLGWMKTKITNKKFETPLI